VTSPILVKNLGTQEYSPVMEKMKTFTHQRNRPDISEIWIVQHPAIFTQGQAGKPEHILDNGNIPVIQSDRGGQVTYHGPGQIIIYPLLDLHALKIGVKSLVNALENAVIDFLHDYNISAIAQKDAPGVYVNNQKIAALGLRIRKGFSYHGMAINIDMDLSPYQRINPCGYQGLEVTQLKDQGIIITPEKAATEILAKLARYLDCEING